MKHCDKCKISIGGKLEKCPLCHAELSGKAEPSVFPRNEAKESGSMALRVFAFSTGVCVLLTVLLWLLTPLPGDITFVICIALVLNFLFVRNILTHRPDFLRVIMRYFIILLAIAVIWFIFTQSLIVSTFVIPSVCLAALLTDAVLIVVFRATFVSGYTKYLLFDVFFGLTPLVFVVAGLTTSAILAYISAFVALVFLLALFVFTRKQMVAEIRKLFSS